MHVYMLFVYILLKDVYIYLFFICCSHRCCCPSLVCPYLSGSDELWGIPAHSGDVRVTDGQQVAGLHFISDPHVSEAPVSLQQHNFPISPSGVIDEGQIRVWPHRHRRSFLASFPLSLKCTSDLFGCLSSGGGVGGGGHGPSRRIIDLMFDSSARRR